MCEPDNGLLNNRSWNEAYCTAIPGKEYGVFFPDGGNVLLDISAVQDANLSIHWLDIRESRWLPVQNSGITMHNKLLPLITPREEGYWAAFIDTHG